MPITEKVHGKKNQFETNFSLDLQFKNFIGINFISQKSHKD